VQTTTTIVSGIHRACVTPRRISVYFQGALARVHSALIVALSPIVGRAQAVDAFGMGVPAPPLREQLTSRLPSVPQLAVRCILLAQVVMRSLLVVCGMDTGATVRTIANSLQTQFFFGCVGTPGNSLKCPTSSPTPGPIRLILPFPFPILNLAPTSAPFSLPRTQLPIGGIGGLGGGVNTRAPTPHPTASCAAFSSCSSCVPRSDCMWSSGACVSIANELCLLGCATSLAQCPVCSNYKDCGTCTSEFCFWNTASNSCAATSSQGSVSWNGCPPTGCAVPTTCTSCVQTTQSGNQCVWNQEIRTCQSFCQNPPDYGEAYCESVCPTSSPTGHPTPNPPPTFSPTYHPTLYRIPRIPINTPPVGETPPGFEGAPISSGPIRIEAVVHTPTTPTPTKKRTPTPVKHAPTPTSKPCPQRTKCAGCTGDSKCVWDPSTMKCAAKCSTPGTCIRSSSGC